MPCSYYMNPRLNFSYFIEFIFVFLAYQDKYFNQSNHVTFKVDKCEGDHIPTCILDNKTYLFITHFEFHKVNA